MTPVTGDRAPRLGAWALFAGLISVAGLPIYIHAPKFFVDTYGVGLGTLGVVLSLLRLIDVVQDPLLGWVVARWRAYRRVMVAVGAGAMAVAMVGLFAVVPPIAPLGWFALMMAVLFSGFSLLGIAFYAQGVRKAQTLGARGHIRLAGWREGGALVGVSLAAVAPVVLGLVFDRPFAAFAFGFVGMTVLALWAMRREWDAPAIACAPRDALPDLAAPEAQAAGWPVSVVLRDPLSRRLLGIAFLNAAPVAVTSTLFLFYVESRLAAPGLEGPLLLAFFLAAAVSVPGWSLAAQHFGARRVLLAGMGLAIVTFAFAATLGAGDAGLFALVCLASGAALGADMTLLPALFARRMAVIAPEAGVGFGLWAFVSKMTLALAAVVLLPVLDMQGFQGSESPQSALNLLAMLYALLPCALKLFAMALLAATPIEDE